MFTTLKVIEPAFILNASTSCLCSYLDAKVVKISTHEIIGGSYFVCAIISSNSSKMTLK